MRAPCEHAVHRRRKRARQPVAAVAPQRLADEVLVRERDEQRAIRARPSSSRRRVSSSECSVFLFRSWPGSSTIRSGGTPRASASSRRSVRNAATSADDVVVVRLRGTACGAPRGCARSRWSRRPRRRRPPSRGRARPVVSLMIAAPACDRSARHLGQERVDADRRRAGRAPARRERPARSPPRRAPAGPARTSRRRHRRCPAPSSTAATPAATAASSANVAPRS